MLTQVDLVQSAVSTTKMCFAFVGTVSGSFLYAHSGFRAVLVSAALVPAFGCCWMVCVISPAMLEPAIEEDTDEEIAGTESSERKGNYIVRLWEALSSQRYILFVIYILLYGAMPTLANAEFYFYTNGFGCSEAEMAGWNTSMQLARIIGIVLYPLWYAKMPIRWTMTWVCAFCTTAAVLVASASMIVTRIQLVLMVAGYAGRVIGNCCG